MDPISQFNFERSADIKKMSKDDELKGLSLEWMLKADKYKYTYNFKWLGRPIIKYPNDMVVTQEIIWEVKPDLIIETGIAHGGSLIFSASMLELIGGNGQVIGIDIDIRSHNRKEIENHPLFKRIKLFEGSSISEEIINEVKEAARGKQKIMVILDSSHTYEHVFNEIKAYSSLVSVNSYLIVGDTFIEYFPKNYFNDRPWDVGNNPAKALKEFLAGNDDFQVDAERMKKLLITETFDGYLKRIK